MKKVLSICLALFSVLGNLASVEHNPVLADSISEFQVVSAVLRSVPDPELKENPYTALLLDNGAVWQLIKENLTGDEGFPRRGDAVRCSNGSTFYNVTRGGIFFAFPVGHASMQPLILEKIHHHNLFSTLQYFLATFLKSQDELQLMFDPDVDIIFYLLNNDLYYAIDPSPKSFDEWREGEKLLLVRPDRKECDLENSQEMLINLNRSEIRKIEAKEYVSDTIGSINEKTLTVGFSQLNENWNIDPSQNVILSNWSPGDAVRILPESFCFEELSETDPELIWLLSLIFGEETIHSLQEWKITIAIAINLENETSLFCWKWTRCKDSFMKCSNLPHKSRGYSDLLKFSNTRPRRSW
jgi:hypothetical protein